VKLLLDNKQNTCGIDYKRRTKMSSRRMDNIEALSEQLGSLQPKCFNYNKYGHMAKECWKKKEKEIRRYFRYDKKGHIAKDCKERQSMKKWKI